VVVVPRFAQAVAIPVANARKGLIKAALADEGGQALDKAIAELGFTTLSTAGSKLRSFPAHSASLRAFHGPVHSPRRPGVNALEAGLWDAP